MMTLNELIEKIPKDLHRCKILIYDYELAEYLEVYSVSLDQSGANPPVIILRAVL